MEVKDGKVSYCITGALDAADTANTHAYEVLREQIRGPLSYWNDNPKRTKEQVLAAFDAAIKAQK